MTPTYLITVAVIYFLYARFMTRKKMKNWMIPIVATGVFLIGQLALSFYGDPYPLWVSIMTTLVIFGLPVLLTVLLSKPEYKPTHD